MAALPPDLHEKFALLGVFAPKPAAFAIAFAIAETTAANRFAVSRSAASPPLAAIPVILAARSVVAC